MEEDHVREHFNGIYTDPQVLRGGSNGHQAGQLIIFERSS